MGPGAGVEHNIHHCFLFLCPWVLSAAVGALESRVVGGILHKCDFFTFSAICHDFSNHSLPIVAHVGSFQPLTFIPLLECSHM